MERDQYYNLAWRTAKVFQTQDMNLIHAALGLTSEAGELCEFSMQVMVNNVTSSDGMLEELGDVYWFLAYAAGMLVRGGWHTHNVHLPILLGLPSSQLFLDEKGQPFGGVHDISEDLDRWRKAAFYVQPLHEAVMSLSAACGQYATLVKSSVVYGKHVPQEAYYNALLVVGKTLRITLEIARVPFEKVAQKNIDKLQKRYPDKYTDYDAIARADKAEGAAENSVIDIGGAVDSDGGTPD